MFSKEVSETAFFLYCVYLLALPTNTYYLYYLFMNAEEYTHFSDDVNNQNCV